MGIEREAFAELRNELQKASGLSIDALLQYREEFLPIGKLAIAAALLPKEKTPSLRPKDGDWLAYLLGLMYSSAPQGQPNRVAFVTFNYDRLIEHKITSFLSAVNGIPMPDAWEIASHIPIAHVYGQLGGYHPTPREGAVAWANEKNNPSNFPDISAISQRTIEASEGIRLVHERGDETEQVLSARRLLGQAERVFFLGFGFDVTNMARLAAKLPRADLGTAPVVMGSALGLEEGERRLAGSLIRKHLKRGSDRAQDLGADNIRLVARDSLTTLRIHADRLD